MIHERLVRLLEEEFGSHLEEEPRFFYDGVEVRLKNGFKLTFIYPEEREYSFSWSCEGREERIDTAPIHKGLKTHPNHHHLADGEVEEDRLTSPQKSPEENLRSVLEALLGRSP